ncbi:MAG: cache domain-containing protein [Acidobacteriia bacterium]|nr:cache domain-containing protein [Terriglobia bacterium]
MPIKRALSSNKLFLPALTSVAVVALFALYDMGWVTRQQAYYNDRAFRVLDVIGVRIVTALGGLKNILASSTYTIDPGAAPERPALYVQNVLGLSPGDIANDVPVAMRRRLEAVSDETTAKAPFRMSLMPNRRGFWIHAEYVEPKPNAPLRCDANSAEYYSCLDVNLAPVVAPLISALSEGLFNDLFIADATGHVLYQHSPSPLRATELKPWIANAIAPPKSGDKADAPKVQDLSFDASDQRAIQIGDAKYRLYVQPLALKLDNNERLVVAGIRDVERLEMQALSVPHGVVVWVTLLLAAIFTFTWPILKIWYMSEAERLQHKQAVTLIVTVLWGAAFATAIVLWGAYEWRAPEREDTKLERFANAIETNLRKELNLALSVLERSRAADYPIAFQATKIYASRFFAPPVSDYPYFSYMFWVNGAGAQTLKLTADPQGTPLRSVAAAEYFKRAKEAHDSASAENLFSTPRDGSPGRHRYWLEPLRSPSTDEFLTILAMPAELPPAGTTPVSASKAPVVKVMAVRLESIWQSVLPRGYGFAIVDGDGLVKFHSNPAHNLVEDFTRETQSDRALAALLRQHGAGIVRTTYMGRPEIVRVAPLRAIDGAGWSLLTFHDTRDDEAVNVAMVMSPLWMFGLPLGIVALIVLPFAKQLQYPLAWAWPRHDAALIYGRSGVFNLMLLMAAFVGFADRSLLTDSAICLTAIGLALAYFATVERLPRVALALEIVAVVVFGYLVRHSAAFYGVAAYFVLAMLCAWAPRAQAPVRRWPGSRVYPFGAASLLLIVIALPMATVFKGTVESVERLALMREQLSVAVALAAREERVEQLYTRLGAPALGPERIDLRLDRYDDALVQTGDPPLQADASSPCLPIPGCPLTSEQVRFVLDRFIGYTIEKLARTDAGAELGALSRISDNNPAASIQWTRTGVRLPKGGQIVMQAALPRTRAETIRSAFPRWAGVGRRGGLGITAIWLGLGVWLYVITRQLFFATYRSAPPLETRARGQLADRHTIVLGPPRSGKRHYVGAFGSRVTVIDLRVLALEGSPWTLPDGLSDIVALDHFDHDIDQPAANAEKLRLVETLMLTSKKTVYLLSAVDPVYYLASGFPQTMVAEGTPAAEAMLLLDRWSEVLSRFETVLVEDRSVAPFAAFVERLRGRPFWREPAHARALECACRECDRTPHLRHLGRRLLIQQEGNAGLNEDMMLGLVADRASAYYRALWTTCSKQERLALFQLAADGWVNPKNKDAIMELDRRGLITSPRGFRVMNETFRRFVSASTYPNEVAEWETQERQSTWRALKLSLGIAGLLGAVWLFYAQQEFFDSSLAYIGGSITAATTLLKLVSDMRQKAGGKAV